MTRTMLVASQIGEPPAGGRDLLSKLLRDCLAEICGGDLIVEALERRPVSGGRQLRQALAGYVDGLNPHVERRILDRAQSQGVRRIFIDGSNYGSLARAAKRRDPSLQVLTFFHNVEVRFFFGSLRQRPSPRAIGVLIANYRAERSAVRHSDRILTLSERDSHGIARLYGRGATDIFPMAMEDKRTGNGTMPPHPGGYALFVGGGFYANEAGIRWYAEHVAPHVPMRTVVVGRGLEHLRDALSHTGNVDLVGEVDSLEPWYNGAKVTIAPIFDGSGMKTKVAEALMFGKRVIGTSEAFCGYEAVAERTGWRCNSRDEFISVIGQLQSQALPAFDTAMRALYEEHYSGLAARRRMAAILAEAR